MDWSKIINKKNLAYLLLSLLAFFLAYFFDRYYIYRERLNFLTGGINIFNGLLIKFSQ